MKQAIRFVKVVGVTAGLGILLVGCSQTGSGLFSKKTFVEASASHKDWRRPSGLDAQTMYQILVAEMLVKRGQPAQAFEMLYPIAQRLRDPGLVRYVFQLSMYTYQESNIEKATYLWLEMDPKTPTPWKAAFLISVRKGDLERGMQQWQTWQALTEEPLYQDILDTAQRVAKSVPESQGGVCLQALSKQFGQVWSAPLAVGWLAFEQGRYQEAWSALNRAWQLTQKLDQGAEKTFAQKKTAQLLLEVALKRPQYGAELLDGQLRGYLNRHSEDLVLQQKVARLQVQMQRFDQAKQTFHRLLQQEPDNSAALFGLGVLSLQLQDLATAEQSFKRLKRQTAYRAVAFYYLGRIAQMRQNWHDARRFFERVEQGPFVVDAKIQLALLQVVMQPRGQGVKAAHQQLMQLEQAVVQAQLNAQAERGANNKALAKIWAAKAKLYTQEGKVQKAIAAYRQAIDYQPEMQWQFALAALLYDAKQFEAYQRVLQSVLKQDPNDADALNALGFFYVEQRKNLQEAKVLLERALRIAPDRYYIMDSMGWWYFMMGDYEKAEVWLQRALDKQMDDEVLMHLIEAKWYAGKQQEAKALWQKYHAQYPRNVKLQALIKQLQHMESGRAD